MRRGLVFGKFMPLHRGHELVINTALSECDEVTIVVYDITPKGTYPAMPVEKRLGWIRSLFPPVHALLSLPNPVTADNPDSPDYAPDYAEQVKPFGPFDRVYSSEPGYEEFAYLLGAKHVIVDEARATVPISGTEIRKNPYENRGWMDPIVYSDLVKKVVFVGTESTGKSTMARIMSERYDTVWTHEYGRELWEEQGLKGSYADHLKIAIHQRGREVAAAKAARDYVFCDTNAWTTLHWCLHQYGTADPRLHQLVNETVNDYIYIFCNNDFGWIQDGTRELAGEESQHFHDQLWSDLHIRKIPFTPISGSIEQRTRTLDMLLKRREGR